MTQESSRPSHEDGDGAQDQTTVTMNSTQFGEFHTPMQCSQEGENDGTISDLDVLKGVEVVERRLEIETGQGRDGVYISDQSAVVRDTNSRIRIFTCCFSRRFTSEENGTDRSTEVGDRTCQTKVQDRSRNSCDHAGCDANLLDQFTDQSIPFSK